MHPKYIEFPNNKILLFQPAFKHNQLANRLSELGQPVSAGSFFIGSMKPFYSCSYTLNLKSNLQLELKGRWHFGCSASGQIACANDPEILLRLGMTLSEKSYSLGEDWPSEAVEFKPPSKQKSISPQWFFGEFA